MPVSWHWSRTGAWPQRTRRRNTAELGQNRFCFMGFLKSFSPERRLLIYTLRSSVPPLIPGFKELNGPKMRCDRSRDRPPVPFLPGSSTRLQRVAQVAEVDYEKDTRHH